jgi:acetyltransferase
MNKHHPLDIFFAPESVALIGATDRVGSVGRTILSNLIGNPFGGTVYPINPKRKNTLGLRTWPCLAALPDKADLAVIVTPAPATPSVLRECSDHGIKAAIVISAGFRETGPAGAELECQVAAEAKRAGIRLIGPNCLGVMCPITGFNGTFAESIAHAGSIGFLSQSGALCSAVLEWSYRERIGFSAVVSTGSMADVDWGDLIEYLGSDPHTRSIVIYMESVINARRFLSAAREVALQKPIIIIKAGRTAQAAKAAASHTGALTGSDSVLDAAFRRCGVLRVNTISEIFDMLEVLARQPGPRGPRLLIVTNAGGPGVLATDALLAGGGELAELSAETVQALNNILPRHWSHGNPVDLIGDADPERYAKAIDIAARDSAVDGVLVVMAPQGMTDPIGIAERLTGNSTSFGKPVLASWMGGEKAGRGAEVLNRSGIPTFSFPDAAVRAFCLMWNYSYNLRGLYETPELVEPPQKRADSTDILAGVQAEHREILTETEAKQVLSRAGIPVIEGFIASSADEAVAFAEKIGYPVALKLNSRKITHKTDVGGVQLDLRDAAAVRFAFESIRAVVSARAGADAFEGTTVQRMVDSSDGYELILGSSIDPQFGPVLLFGAGGQLVELFNDHALALPPLTTTLARRLMEQTQIYKALKGVRGRKPVDLSALEYLLVRFSQLVVEQPRIREIEINPLLASPAEIVAMDARILLHGNDVPKNSLPRPAIRPYPFQYTKYVQLTSGAQIRIRPIRPEDETLMIQFHQTLSDRSVHLRYFAAIALDQRTAHERLSRLCFIDYDRQIAFVAVTPDRKSDSPRIVGVGRLVKLTTCGDAEVAFVISDDFQGQGIGTEFMRLLIQFARDQCVTTLQAIFMAENEAMRRLCLRFGFQIVEGSGNEITARLVLKK